MIRVGQRSRVRSQAPHGSSYATASFVTRRRYAEMARALPRAAVVDAAICYAMLITLPRAALH